MAKRKGGNGTPAMVGGSVPVKPNAGINVPSVTGSKVSNGKGRKGSGKSSKTFSNNAGTRSGIMRNPS